MNVYYCPVYVDKITAFKRKYGLIQKCWNLKDFNQCWDRVINELRSLRPNEIIEKDTAAQEYVELVTFVTHKNFRIENSDGMKTLKKCETKY